jgi:hypothetical protein
MCHPYPGPRCSAHAYADYLKALSRYESATLTDERLRLGEILEEKKKSFEATPRGLRRLNNDLNGTEDDGEKDLIQQRINEAKALRNSQFEAYKAAQLSQEDSVKSTLKAEGVSGRYEQAAGIAFDFISNGERSLEAEIESLTSIKVQRNQSSSNILVVPQKYQAIWGSFTFEDGAFSSDYSDMNDLLRREKADLNHLSGPGRLVAENWFIGKLRSAGYGFFAAVNTANEAVYVGIADEIFDHVSIGLKLQPKLGGTTPYTGTDEELLQLLTGTPYEGGVISRSHKPARVHLTSISRQSQRNAKFGSVLLAWREELGIYEVRRSHVSKTDNLIVKLVHKSIQTAPVESLQAALALDAIGDTLDAQPETA